MNQPIKPWTARIAEGETGSSSVPPGRALPLPRSPSPSADPTPSADSNRQRMTSDGTASSIAPAKKEPDLPPLHPAAAPPPKRAPGEKSMTEKME